MASFVAIGPETPTWQILVVHVVLMVSLAALFTPVFTMGLGALPPQLYSHGSSLLGTTQQVAGAMGTALVGDGHDQPRRPRWSATGSARLTASLGGLRWAFAVVAALCVVVGWCSRSALIAARPTGDRAASSTARPELDRESR